MVRVVWKSHPEEFYGMKCLHGRKSDVVVWLLGSRQSDGVFRLLNGRQSDELFWLLDGRQTLF
jgi:hypothetical protein